MPTKQPSTSYQHIRNYTEKFQWRDKTTGLLTTGYNPPLGAKELQRVPFHIVYVTKSGRLERGNCVCLKVDRRKGMRMVQFVESRQFRWVYDILVIEIDGMRFFAH